MPLLATVAIATVATKTKANLYLGRFLRKARVNMASVVEISAVNLIVGWCELDCVRNSSISDLLTSHNEKLSSMHRFQITGFMTLLRRICLHAVSVIKSGSFGNDNENVTWKCNFAKLYLLRDFSNASNQERILFWSNLYIVREVCEN